MFDLQFTECTEMHCVLNENQAANYIARNHFFPTNTLSTLMLMITLLDTV